MKIFKLLGLFLCLGCADEAQMDITTIEPGETAPTFYLKNVDGKMISPRFYPDAKGFILVFTSNTCPYAKKYEDRLIALDKKFAPKGYPVIAINPNSPTLSPGDSYKKMKKRAKTKGFSFPYLFDEDQKVTDLYGARVTPHFFLLNKEESGLKVMYTGALDNDTQDVNPNKTLYIENAIASLEAGNEIEESSTRAIGCSVKRKFRDVIP